MVQSSSNARAEKVLGSCTKFSQLILNGNVQLVSVWRICMGILGLKGLIVSLFFSLAFKVEHGNKNSPTNSIFFNS